MRTEEEIHRAHDMLIAVVLEEVPMPLDEKGRNLIAVAAGVLCWVLEHHHNQAFANDLASIEKYLAAQGFNLMRKHERN